MRFLVDTTQESLDKLIDALAGLNAEREHHVARGHLAHVLVELVAGTVRVLLR